MSMVRLRALIVVGVLVVSACVMVTVALVRDKQAHSVTATGCGDGNVPVDLRMPADRSTVKLNIFNATDSPGLASQVADDFKSRKFTVVHAANDPAAKRVEGVAQLRHGPKTVGAAWVVRAHFLNEAELVFDINRQDDVIDVVLGTGFKQLGTTTETNQALGQVGTPRLPEGTCDANA
jgi:hypothetical protein